MIFSIRRCIIYIAHWLTFGCGPSSKFWDALQRIDMATAAARVGELLGDLSQARKRPAEPSFERSPAKRRSGVKAISSLDFAAFQVTKQWNFELLQLLCRPAWPPSAPTCGVGLTVRMARVKCLSRHCSWLGGAGWLWRGRSGLYNVLLAGESDSGVHGGAFDNSCCFVLKPIVTPPALLCIIWQ